MLKHVRRPLAALTLLFLSGCHTHTEHIYSLQDVTNQTTIEPDKYLGLIYVKGVVIGITQSDYINTQRIIATVKPNGEIIEAWIDYHESGPDSPVQFIAANDANARPLKIHALTHEHSTRYTEASEEVAIDLPPDYLQTHLNSGFDIRLEGRRGTRSVVFAYDYIQGFRAKLLIAQACIRAKTC
ncbi:MAG TPA: hypothetical protein VGV37_07150 [Aliidongia sp.]|uniref:hypothetical protein n=1 Tax=Aliidongia sp. TaxID=1914230 RepID=UPI002DDD6B69|nr:hypothetical protein [Aliidongia sp.]HEV2674303.1 hypothetical protein [Aliidongia sp.]